MRLDLRCTEAHIAPSDTSGFRVTLEVADAKEALGQILQGTDDAYRRGFEAAREASARKLDGGWGNATAFVNRLAAEIRALQPESAP